MSPSPTDHPTGYARPDQMWTAITARIKNAAPTSVAERQRQFLYDRFLARVFTHAPDAWVLKGGTALLSRVRDARHSRDVDLSRNAGTLADAVQELRDALATDLDDHVRFVAAASRPIAAPLPGPPRRAAARIEITPYVGVRSLHAFGVDIVVGHRPLAAPDLQHPPPVVTVPGMISPPYRLYSVADHVADKVCATMELYAGLPSSRHRDLVDLVIIACTQTVPAAPLAHAIEAERLYRDLPPITAWTSPPQWATLYAREARAVPHCAGHRTYAAATTLIAHFLDPILTGERTAGTWNPSAHQWTNLVHP